MESLSLLAAKVVAQCWDTFTDRDRLLLPENLLFRVSQLLSPWQLFTSRDIFKSRQVSTHEQWKRLTHATWKYTYLRRHDALKSLYNEQRIKLDEFQLMLYVENVFHDLLDLNRDNVADCANMLSKLLTPRNSPKSTTISHADVKNYSLCLEFDTWIPHVYHLSLHSSKLISLINSNLLQKMKNIESLAIVQLNTRDLENAKRVIKCLLRTGKLKCLKIALNKINTLDNHVTRDLLWLCTGHNDECDIIRNSVAANDSARQDHVMVPSSEVDDLYTVAVGVCKDQGLPQSHMSVTQNVGDDWTYGDFERVSCSRDGCNPGLRQIQLCYFGQPQFSTNLAQVLPYLVHLERIELRQCNVNPAKPLWHALALKTAPSSGCSGPENIVQLKHIELIDLAIASQRGSATTTGAGVDTATRAGVGVDIQHSALIAFLAQMSTEASPLDVLAIDQYVGQAPQPEEEDTQPIDKGHILFCRCVVLKSVPKHLIRKLVHVLKGNHKLESFLFKAEPYIVYGSILNLLDSVVVHSSSLTELTIEAYRLNNEEEGLLMRALPTLSNLTKLSLKSAFSTSALVGQPRFLEGILRSLRHLATVELDGNRLGRQACRLLASLVDDATGNATTAIQSLSLGSNLILVLDLLEVVRKMVSLRSAKRGKLLHYLGLLHLLGSPDDSITCADVHSALQPLVTECDVTGLVYQMAVADYIAVM